jgi:hypothetical protein
MGLGAKLWNRILAVSSSKTAGFALPLILCLAGSACSKQDGWWEEVRLADGRMVMVERGVKIEKKMSAGLRRPAVTRYSLRVINPSSQNPIRWKGAYALAPIVLDFQGDEAYLVSLPMTCDADLKPFGNPNPPYIAQKWKSGRWVQIPLTDLPATIRHANMLGEYQWGRGGSPIANDRVEPFNESLERNTGGFFQIEIPVDFESWHYEHKNPNGYEECG